MILIKGSKGKIGTAVTGFLRKKKIKFVQTARSKSYKKINNSYVKLDLLKENHIKKIFKDFKFQHIIHLAVTRNPFHIKKIRTRKAKICPGTHKSRYGGSRQRGCFQKNKKRF